MSDTDPVLGRIVITHTLSETDEPCFVDIEGSVPFMAALGMLQFAIQSLTYEAFHGGEGEDL